MDADLVSVALEVCKGAFDFLSAGDGECEPDCSYGFVVCSSGWSGDACDGDAPVDSEDGHSAFGHVCGDLGAYCSVFVEGLLLDSDDSFFDIVGVGYESA